MAAKGGTHLREGWDTVLRCSCEGSWGELHSSPDAHTILKDLHTTGSVILSGSAVYGLYIQTVLQTAIQTVVKTVQTIQTARGGLSSIDPFLRGLYGLYSFYNGLYHGLYHGLYV